MAMIFRRSMEFFAPACLLRISFAHLCLSLLFIAVAASRDADCVARKVSSEVELDKFTHACDVSGFCARRTYGLTFMCDSTFSRCSERFLVFLM